MHNFFTPTTLKLRWFKKSLCANPSAPFTRILLSAIFVMVFESKNHAKAHPTMLHGLRRLVAPYEVFMLNF